MRLIERFAVIRVRAAPHLRTTPQPDLYKPIGICERLPRHPNHVSLVQPQYLFRLFKRRDTPGRNYRRAKTCRVHRALDRRHKRNAASEWTSLIRQDGRHALVTTLPGVWINRLAHFRLLRVFKLAT